MNIRQEQLNSNITVEFPEITEGCISQGNDEYCLVRSRDSEMEVRFHEYQTIYTVEGLYEHLFYQKLKCCSPQMICSQLRRELKKSQIPPDKLRVLDFGAGNGMVAEELQRMGVQNVVGLDIIEEAGLAARRDRPHVYDNYYVADVIDLPKSLYTKLKDYRFNCLVTVAALGFDDVPPLAFAEAYNLISSPGWVAFNIKEHFLEDGDQSGFSHLVHQMIDHGIMDLRISSRYRHRYCLDGTPLYYVAIVGRKQNNIPDKWLHRMRTINRFHMGAT
ncbi:MAG: class I SAM-dependent methyltransferase [wastewater metagenome]|nr:class I SAM-dependent methyltransferase [Candidatus Loosdrechtia aerotolerans]